MQNPTQNIDFFNATLDPRGNFTDNWPRLIKNAGQLLLTATQNRSLAPHDQLFYINLNQNIQSGTHQIPGPMVNGIVYQERNRDAAPGAEWTVFSVKEGQLALLLDRQKKTFKGSFTFTAHNKEQGTFSATASTSLTYNF